MTLPTPKMERWKYTNLPAKLKKLDLTAGEADIALSGMVEYAQVFPSAADDLPAWVKDTMAHPAPGADKYRDMMLWQAANDAMQNGFIVDVPQNTKVDEALEVTHTGRQGSQATVRQIIRVADGASFTLIEHQTGVGAYWNNIVTQIELGHNARFEHYRFQQNSDEAVVTHNTHIVMEQGATYEAFTLIDGAKLSRNQIHAEMNGENACCRLNGLNLLDEAEHADTTITVEHHAPHCQSFQNYRTVADDKAVGVFQGKIHVHQAAQKTDGYQMAKSLLLSKQAAINTKPELEIYADDVKCSHGATTGQLDEKALFYMRSRGIAEDAARNLLVQAFLSEVVTDIADQDVREKVASIASEWLS